MSGTGCWAGGSCTSPTTFVTATPPQNLELLNWLADELVRAKYDLKHIYREILNSQTYQLSCIPKHEGPEAAANFACYSLPTSGGGGHPRRDLPNHRERRNRIPAWIPEPFTFIPEKQRSITLPDGSITSSVLELLGRPPRDSGFESERNNRFNAAQALHLINSSHILKKIREGAKIKELLESTGESERAEVLYLTILSRKPTEEERNQVAWQANSRGGAQDLAWALINSGRILVQALT